MFRIADYHGNRIAIDPARVIKLRAALPNDEPLGTGLVDYASNGSFAKGTLPEIAKSFGGYLRLAPFHAQNDDPIFVNKSGIAAIAIDNRHAGNAVPIVTVEFENIRVRARNRIGVQEIRGASPGDPASRDVDIITTRNS
jgi:hypothetical protein